MPAAESAFANDFFYAAPAGGAVLEGLSIGSLMAAYYDTNAGQAAGTADDPEVASLALTVSPSLTWRGWNSSWRTEVEASAGYTEYAGHDEYSGGNHSIDASVGYDGGHWDLVGTIEI